MCWFWDHKWAEKERHKGFRENYMGGREDALMIIQECTKCGKLKKVIFP